MEYPRGFGRYSSENFSLKLRPQRGVLKRLKCIYLQPNFVFLQQLFRMIAILLFTANKRCFHIYFILLVCLFETI